MESTPAPSGQSTPQIVLTYVGPQTPNAPTVIPLVTVTPEATPAPATETPAPVTPTATAALSACPAPASPTPPAKPDVFTSIADALLPYLSAGATATATRELLVSWGVIFSAPDGAETLGGVYQAKLLPGNDLQTVAVMFDPDVQMATIRAGEVAVYTCVGGAVQLTYRALADPSFAGAVGYPRVLSTADVNGDGLDELSFVTGECGASTCFDSVTVLSFQPDGGVSNLISDFTPQPFPAFTFTPAAGGATQDLSVQVGQYGSAGAGPQRRVTQTWSWNGATFTLTNSLVEPPVYRLHALHDGDTAFRKGDYATATALYQRVVSDPSLKSWDGLAPMRDEDKVLGAFALFRLVELAAIQKDAANLGPAYESLKGAAQEGSPGELYGLMGDAFYSAYTASGDYTQACDAAVSYAAKSANTYVLLGSQMFGYANYDYQPADMCIR